jgi:hypothetical protein
MGTSRSAPSAEHAPTGWPRRPWRLVGKRTLAFAALLVSVELVLRFGAGHGAWVVHERSARYGWRMLPDQDGRSRLLSVPETINADGFRDRDWARPRRDGRGGWQQDDTLFRVAVLGNSLTYGSSVRVEDVYTRRLEDRLAQALSSRGSPRRALVMNFAVQGYCLEQMARVYEDLVRPYRPDLLVVPFHPRDVVSMAPSSDEPGGIVRRWMLRTAIHDVLARHVIDRWLPPGSSVWRDEVLDRTPEALAVNLGPFAPENHPLFDAASTRLDDVMDQVERDGGQLLVMGLPSWRQHFDDAVLSADAFVLPWAWERRGRVVVARPGPAFERLMRPVVAELDAKGLVAGGSRNVSTLVWRDRKGRPHQGDELQSADSSLYLLRDSAHYSARGHAVLADALAAAIDEAGLLDR